MEAALGVEAGTEVVGQKEGHYPHIRSINWKGRVGRDRLSVSARNTLGSSLTLFNINEEVAAELLARGLETGAPHGLPEEWFEPGHPDIVKPWADGFSALYEDESSKAHELIKDTILKLSWKEAERLVAALLQAMGYKARVTPEGPIGESMSSPRPMASCWKNHASRPR